MAITKKSTSDSSNMESKTSKGSKLSLKDDPEQKKSGCCMGTPACPPSTSLTTTSVKPPPATTPSLFGNESKKGPKTRITVKYNVGFGNSISLRGKGANLSWDKGLPLKNVKSDEWVWETDQSFSTGEFKVLINDKQYEIGNNHILTCGANIHYSPKF